MAEILNEKSKVERESIEKDSEIYSLREKTEDLIKKLDSMIANEGTVTEVSIFIFTFYFIIYTH